MAHQDKFFEDFRQQSNELREQPSSDAWRRIEQRVQAPRSRLRVVSKRSYTPRLVGMAASLALLIGLSVTLFWLGRMDSDDPGPMAQAAPMIEWEELPTAVASTDGPREVVQIAVRHPRPQVANPIEEGRPEQRLLVRNAVRPSGASQAPGQVDSVSRGEKDHVGR